LSKKMKYEIETRVYFDSQEEAFKTLPFLNKCLRKKTEFKTSMYGMDLFNSGNILRVSEVTDQFTKKIYLGYKEIDIGRIYNIRNEIDEEINDELNESTILQAIEGLKQKINIKNLYQLLESFGYQQFMVLSGTNLTGHLEEFQIDLKLMQCSSLKYPLLLEIEKSAETIEGAFNQELNLKKFITEHHLESQIIKEEPPYLLNVK